MLKKTLPRLCLVLFMAVATASVRSARGQDTAPAGFVAYDPAADFQLPEIVLQYDPVAKTGSNWAQVKQAQWYDASPAVLMGRSATYVREGLNRMTGRTFSVVSKADLSAGIVITLLKDAPEAIRKDPEVLQALRPDPKDRYSAKEAFFIRSEPKRVLLVANTPDGMLDAAAEFLESVDYEVLGMGPNWVYAPDYKGRALVFALKRDGRPSFYIRGLGATSGQSYGVGTIMSGLTDPADEPVFVSYWRWVIGARIVGKSMSGFPGHALQAFHSPLVEHMRKTGATEGFLVAKSAIGRDAQRLAAAPENKDWLWINDDAAGQPGAGKIYYSDGKKWTACDISDLGVALDLSVPFVRQLILDQMEKQAEDSFKTSPDEPAIIGIDPEDGTGTGALLYAKYKNWYPEYLAQENLPFGRPYVLNGYKGLDQPKETWDPISDSDTMFGCADYLLHEFDKWVDSLPKERQVTSTGQSKKDLIRCSFYSYNYHDVPPDFNPDPRIRVMIAGYPKHRGHDKWERYASQEDVARAFKIMLPREPSGDYRIISLAYYWDPGPANIPASWSASPKAIAEDYRRAYDAGYRAMNFEIDFNFGKFGLAYYLMTKVLWNVNLTADDLDAIRDRWFQRAFGSGWKEMKAYYDFMLTENYPVNGPNSWAKAIRFIDAADKKIDGAKEPDAQRRLDDVKQYWYYHYLTDDLKPQPYAGYKLDKKLASAELKEYLWKGQMSYMVALHVPVRHDFGAEGVDGVKEAVGPKISTGPAHYTHEETETWWAKVLARWKWTPVVLFADATLADGRPAKGVDLNDMVMVREFQNGVPDAPFCYNSGYMKPPSFLMIARAKDDVIGFTFSWPFMPNDNFYVAKKVFYGVDIWDPDQKLWTPWIDKTKVFQQSQEVTTAKGAKLQAAAVRLQAPRAGTYRFDIGWGGNLASLGSPAYDPAAARYVGSPAFTYSADVDGGLTQSAVYFYIPKGTKHLDLEVFDQYKGKWVQFFRGLPARNPTLIRKVDISAMGTYTITLLPGEDGTVATVGGNGFAFPYLYSIPMFWAKSPAALLVPRGIAEADGLTLVK